MKGHASEYHCKYPSQKPVPETCTCVSLAFATRESGKRKILTEPVATLIICIVLLRTRGRLYRSRPKFKIVFKLELYGDT